MANYQKIKGTQDFYGDYILKYRYVEKVASDVAKKYGFGEMKTPVFENTEVFVRSVGEESDVVSKEMYTFTDKGNRSITLRPEGTAVIARSFTENKLYAGSLPFYKYFYSGPMYRYERPQAGRYREFHQFGVEVFGQGSYLQDVDVIASAYAIINKLKIENIQLKINSIGDFSSREVYQQALRQYFQNHIESMCSDCGRRIHTNPMRILDCKVDKNNPVMNNAPQIVDFLNPNSQSYFKRVTQSLDLLHIPYEIDLQLVRGLDYYTDTVFEFIINSDDEFNGLALCAGGKYSELIKSFNGMDIPGIGYAFGIERLIALMDKQNKWPVLHNDTDFFLIALDSISQQEALQLAVQLRQLGWTVEMDYLHTNLKNQFKVSEKLHARYLIIIGEEERKSEQFVIKDTQNKTQTTINKTALLQKKTQFKKFLEEKKNENA
ncbi:MAG: histidine--tRNA ligase [Bacilli bacterium]|jgi:histidyl-tRNA synthetase|nr:histidine--tRNA ligase [Bacilli bacterium]